MSVLIVDDSDLSLDMAAELVGGLGYEVLTALSGEEAIDILSSERGTNIETILIDYRMPGMDGAETSECIRDLISSRKLKNTNLKIVGMSGDTDEETTSRLYRSGMDAVIGKPLEMAVLIEVLSSDKEEANIKDARASLEDKSEVITLPDDISLYDAGEAAKYSGSEKKYIKYLDNFVALYKRKKEVLANSFDLGDIRTFTIEVHALKSNARSLGNSKLSALAERLEKLGDQQNKEEIGKHLDGFFNLFMNSYEEASRIIKDKREDAHKEESTDNNKLKELLTVLSEAADAFDLDTADVCSNDLQSMDVPSKLQAEVSELLADLADVDFISVKKRAEEIINKL